MPSAAEVTELLAPHLLGDPRDAGARIDVLSLDVEEEERSFTAMFELLAEGERWRVRVPSGDKWELAVFNGRPDPDLVLDVANVLRIRLLEWWHTKDTAKRSAETGTRLN
ncbi:hypothetical protein K378_03795 [Streptomyces sp. Amel2xB2]|uniref:hypothetical protein n=1 Tax=Streptomyces sp. Amel2xB2 TaxID=1305829 RepID=UPI000DBAB161|nr:hypothetical protein [Streptomyces sp. Amel2xB2]RAJ62444.1 hypothetical protein K378_03795 [Streptomyces sp. Amel2xB2]